MSKKIRALLLIAALALSQYLPLNSTFAEITPSSTAVSSTNTNYSGTYYGQFNDNRRIGGSLSLPIRATHFERCQTTCTYTQSLDYYTTISFNLEYFINRGYLYYNSQNNRTWTPSTVITSNNVTTAPNQTVDLTTVSEGEGILANNSPVVFSNTSYSARAWEYTWKYDVRQLPDFSQRIQLNFEIRDRSGNWIPAPANRGKVAISDYVQDDNQIYLRARGNGRFDFEVYFEMEATGYHHTDRRNFTTTQHQNSGTIRGSSYSYNRSIELDTDIEMDILEAHHHGSTLFLKTTYLPPGTNILFNGVSSYTVRANDPIYGAGVSINTRNFSNSTITISAVDPIGRTGDDLFPPLTLGVGQKLNEPPILSLTSPLENERFLKVEGYNEIIVEGQVSDENNDAVTVTATIGDVSKSTVVRNTKNGQGFSIHFDTIEDELPGGKQLIHVVADDGYEGTDEQNVEIEIVDMALDNSFVLVDEVLLFLTKYQDEEGDPMIDEQFEIKHDPLYFENAARTTETPGVDLPSPYEQTTSGKFAHSDSWHHHEEVGFLKEQFENDAQWWYNSFQTVGHYEISYRAKDSPTDDDRFDEFRKWSIPTPALNLFVHRKPVSRFEPYIDINNDEVTIIDQSYDLDSFSQGARGIKQKWWSYRELGSDEWIDGQPQKLDRFKTWEIKLKVEDFQGAFDTSIEIASTDAIANLPPVAGFIHEPIHYIGERVPLTSTAYDPDGDTLEIQYEVFTPSGELITIPAALKVPQEINGEFIYYQRGDPNNLIQYFNAEELGTYEIVQYVSDGQETSIAVSSLEVVDLTIKGKVKHTDQWNEMHLARGCMEICPEFYSGEKFLFEVDIDDYPVLELNEVEQVFVRVEGIQINDERVSIGHGFNEGPTIRPDPIMLNRITGTNKFEGEWYEEWMTTPQSRLKPGSTVQFVYEVVYYKEFEDGSVNEQIRVDDEEILIIGSVYDAFDFHRHE